jgi:hypothetical protein
MTDTRHPSDGTDLVTEALEKAAEKRKDAEDLAFANKLAKRRPPNEVDRAQIEKARRRAKARAPRIAMHIENRPTGTRALYPHHSDEEGHQYRLADTFGTRSRHFVYAMMFREGDRGPFTDPWLNSGQS